MNIHELFNKPFSFQRRKDLLPCDLRVSWKTSLILLMFFVVAKNDRCSLQKIHVINWALKSDSHAKSFRDWSTAQSLCPPDVRMEPALDTAINLMLGGNLLIRENGKLVITSLGKEKANWLSNLDVLCKEKTVMNELRKYLSEANINRIFKV